MAEGDIAITKFRRFEIFRELGPEFPGTDGERQTLPERKNQKRKENIYEANIYETNAPRHIADSYETKS